MKHFFSLIILAILALAFSIKPAVAQQLSSSITPPLYEVAIQPGKTARLSYLMMNQSDPTTFQVRILPIEPRDDSGNVKISDVAAPLSFSFEDQTGAPVSQFLMRTNEYKSVNLKISVPEKTLEKDYYFVILSESIPTPAVEGASTVKIQGVVSSLLYITVAGSGTIEQKGLVSLFDVKPRFRVNIFGKKYNVFDSTDPIPVVLVLQNTGKNLIKTNGQIKLSTGATYPLDSTRILAESQRLATIALSPFCSKNPEHNSCQENHTIVLNQLPIGAYNIKATLDKTFTNENSTVRFVVLPISIAGIGSVAILLLFLGILYLKHKLR